MAEATSVLTCRTKGLDPFSLVGAFALTELALRRLRGRWALRRENVWLIFLRYSNGMNNKGLSA